jgi:hypothetical protein
MLLDTKTGARVMSQTLPEAGWLVPLAFGYLVRDTVPAGERARFERLDRITIGSQNRNEMQDPLKKIPDASVRG